VRLYVMYEVGRMYVCMYVRMYVHTYIHKYIHNTEYSVLRSGLLKVISEVFSAWPTITFERWPGWSITLRSTCRSCFGPRNCQSKPRHGADTYLPVHPTYPTQLFPCFSCARIRRPTLHDEHGTPVLGGLRCSTLTRRRGTGEIILVRRRLMPQHDLDLVLMVSNR